MGIIRLKLLHQVKFMEGFVSDLKEEGIAIIDWGSNQAVNEDFSSVGGWWRGEGQCIISNELCTQ